jgi:hypothetical protein
MTIPILNRHLEEALYRCRDFSTEAQEIATASSGLAEEAVELGKLTEGEAEQLHEELVKTVEAVQAATADLEATVNRALATLDSVPGRAVSSAEGILGTLAPLRAAVIRVDEAREELMTGLRSSAERFDQDRKDLVAAIGQYFERVEKAWKEPAILVHEVPDRAQEMGGVLGLRMREVREDVERLAGIALEHHGDLVRAADNGSQAIADHVVGLLNEAGGRHSEVMAELRERVLDETPGGVADPDWIAEAVAPLRAEVVDLDAVAPQVEDALSAPARALTDAVERTDQQLANAAASLARVLSR